MRDWVKFLTQGSAPSLALWMIDTVLIYRHCIKLESCCFITSSFYLSVYLECFLISLMFVKCLILNFCTAFYLCMGYNLFTQFPVVEHLENFQFSPFINKAEIVFDFRVSPGNRIAKSKYKSFKSFCTYCPMVRQKPYTIYLLGREKGTDFLTSYRHLLSSLFLS